MRGEEYIPPVPTHAHVVRLESPPVGTEPTDQTPPKQTLAAVGGSSLSEILERHDIEPIEELITMYHERDEEGKFVMSPAERRSLMKELLKYKHPQLKAVEHKGRPEDNRITVVIQMPDGSRAATQVEQRGKVVDVG